MAKAKFYMLNKFQDTGYGSHVTEKALNLDMKKNVENLLDVTVDCKGIKNVFQCGMTGSFVNDKGLKVFS
ncbi:hypothetical protein ACFLY8_01585 [Halobacteriota archaeon]